MKRFVLPVVAVVIVVVVGLGIAVWLRDPIDLAGTSRLVSIERADPDALTPVSLAPLGEGLFAFANYRNIYIWDRAAGHAYPVEPLDVPVWNPTAVQYADGLLYIANYTGGDVIVASVEKGNRLSLKLVERIASSEGTVGPEGVHVAGKHMAVADYVGNAASLFERVDGEWIYRWKQSILGAHGITIVGDHVYAGGSGVIAKFDLETGEETARITTYVEEQPVQFATCVNLDATTGQLIGADTIAGRVFRLDLDLNVLDTFGENGPGHDNLSMPYCAYRWSDGILRILSTYQDRVIELGSETLSFEFGDKLRWEREVDEQHSGSTQMFGMSLTPGYNSVHIDGFGSLFMPQRVRLLGGESLIWPYYHVTLADDGDWLALLSSSSPIALLYDRKGEWFYAASLNEWDCWGTGDVIECPNGPIDVEALAKQAIPLTEDDVRMDKGSGLRTLLGYWWDWRASRPSLDDPS